MTQPDLPVLGRSRPCLLDLFCGAGGAAYGYHDAGFDIIGVDDKPQPNYPFEFLQADAIDFLAEYVAALVNPHDRFDAIHASPPCQSFTAYRRKGHGVGDGYPDLIEPVRGLLARTGVPTVIENVGGAPLRDPIMLCGSTFGLDVRRHRYFELDGFTVEQPGCDHAWQTPRFAPASNRTNLRRTVEVGVWRIPLDVQQRAMGIDWMTLPELSEAIPPAYTRWIGWDLSRAVSERRAA